MTPFPCDDRFSLSHCSLLSHRSVADPDDLLLEEEDLSLLGLDDPQRPLNELDWRGLYQTFCHLRVLTPKPSLAAAWEKQDEGGTGDRHVSAMRWVHGMELWLTQGSASPVAVFPLWRAAVSVVPWRNTTLPLRRSHELLLRLDHHISVLHVNSLAYTTQVLVEIILGVAGMKSEHEAQILAMLRETGHGKLTMEDIHTLKPVDRLTLEAALADWKRKQARVRRQTRNDARKGRPSRSACTPSHDPVHHLLVLCVCSQLAADRERKRLEEEESTRRREEERRQRLLEQEQRIAQQRRDQQKLDEAAAVSDNKRRLRRCTHDGSISSPVSAVSHTLFCLLSTVRRSLFHLTSFASKKSFVVARRRTAFSASKMRLVDSRPCDWSRRASRASRPRRYARSTRRSSPQGGNIER